MMNAKILFTLICTGASLSLAQGTHLDVKVADTVESDLFGPVKSTHTVYQKEVFKSSSSKHTSRERERTYDIAGNLLIAINKDIDEGETEHMEYSYDTTNGCLFQKIITYSGGETNKDSETFQYFVDVDTKQIMRQDLQTGEFKVTVYTLAGYERYIEYRDSSNTVTQIKQAKRLPDNKEYEYAVFDGEQIPTRTSRIKWNTHGLIREYQYQVYGTNEYTYITKYTHPEKDERGNWTRRVARKDLVHNDERKKYCEENAVRIIEYFDE